MKLYTEEQVNLAMQLATFTDDTYNQVLEKLTPIELPSDEEIEKQTNGFMFEKNKEVFYNGAKWMKEQIGKEDKTFKQKSKWTEVDNMTRQLK